MRIWAHIINRWRADYVTNNKKAKLLGEQTTPRLCPRKGDFYACLKAVYIIANTLQNAPHGKIRRSAKVLFPIDKLSLRS